MRAHALPPSAAVLAVALTLVACTDDREAPTTSIAATDPSNGLPMSALLVIGDDRGTLAQGETTQLVAIVRYEDGTTREVTSEAQWTTSDATKATVSPSGVVAGLDEGLVGIRATYHGMTQADVTLITSPGAAQLVEAGD